VLLHNFTDTVRLERFSEPPTSDTDVRYASESIFPILAGLAAGPRLQCIANTCREGRQESRSILRGRRINVYVDPYAARSAAVGSVHADAGHLCCRRRAPQPSLDRILATAARVRPIEQSWHARPQLAKVRPPLAARPPAARRCRATRQASPLAQHQRVRRAATREPSPRAWEQQLRRDATRAIAARLRRHTGHRHTPQTPHGPSPRASDATRAIASRLRRGRAQSWRGR